MGFLELRHQCGVSHEVRRGFLTLSYFSEERISELGFEVQAGVYQVNERGKENTGQTGCRAEVRRRGMFKGNGSRPV